MLTKADKILMLLSTAIAVVLFGVFFIFDSQLPKSAKIQVEGAEYGRYALDGSQKIEIIKNNHKNIVQIEDGVIKMIDADCPDKLCIEQGAISTPAQTIVCLPNKVIISIEGQGEELDGIAQ